MASIGMGRVGKGWRPREGLEIVPLRVDRGVYASTEATGRSRGRELEAASGSGRIWAGGDGRGSGGLPADLGIAIMRNLCYIQGRRLKQTCTPIHTTHTNQ